MEGRTRVRARDRHRRQVTGAQFVMMVESSNIVRLLLFLALPPLLLGLVLVKLAYFPRRRGNTPHCRKCNYTLTGLSSERCPECGQPLDDNVAVVHGERPRRPILGAV